MLFYLLVSKMIKNILLNRKQEVETKCFTHVAAVRIKEENIQKEKKKKRKSFCRINVSGQEATRPQIICKIY